MKNKKSIILILLIGMILSILGIVSWHINVSYADYCQGITEKVLTSTFVEDEKIWGDQLTDAQKDEVEAIINSMTGEYAYPLTVNDLKSLSMPYLYCRGHNTYLRGTSTNTITRSGDLGGYTITTVTGKDDNIGSFGHEEVDVYSEASTELTFNEFGHFGRKVGTAESIYAGLKIFHVPGINGDAEENDDHYCQEDQFGNEYTYGAEYETVTMSRYKLTETEELYTDEVETNSIGYMAYDAAKSYILTVLKGGHYGPGQVAFWRLKDTIGLTGWEGENEVHTVNETTVVNKLEFDTEDMYQIIEIKHEEVIIEEDESDEENEGFVEDTIDYDSEYLSGGDAGVLYQEAITLGKHVYATEKFKEKHQDLMADCTDFNNMNVNYVKNGDYYLVGPFNIEYIRTVMKSTNSLIPTVKDSKDSVYSFGGIIGAKLTYTTIDGNTKYLSVGTIASGEVETNDGFEFVITDTEAVDRKFDTDYQYPYPGEDFYLKIPYQGENETNAIKALNGIEYSFDNSYAEGRVYNLTGKHYKVTWKANYEGFECEEEAALCDTHHITPGGHCYSDCEFDACSKHECGHESTKTECEGFLGNDRDPAESGSTSYQTQKSCSGPHTHHRYNSKGQHSGCYSHSCSHDNECEEEATRCETHHYTVGDTHYRNRSYWLEPTVDPNEQPSQPLMLLGYAEVHKRTYTAALEFEIDMTMDFGGFVWVDAYTETADDGEFTGDYVYDPAVNSIGGEVKNDTLKPNVEVYLLKKVASEKNGSGEAYLAEHGDATTLGGTYYYAVKPDGSKIYAVTDENGEYKFDEIPVLNSNYEGYVVAFVYDGQTYENVEPLYKGSGGETEYAGEEYMSSADKSAFYNSSMGEEDPEERLEFNTKFKEFLGDKDIDSAYQTIGKTQGELKGAAVSSELKYDGEISDYGRVDSELRTTESEDDNTGMALDYFKFESRTSETVVGTKGLVYPLTDVYNIRVVDKEFTSLTGTNVTGEDDINLTSIEPVYGAPETLSSGGSSTEGSTEWSTGYTANINLGLIVRPQADLSVTKDLYTARTIVKGNDMTYSYGEALRYEEAQGYGAILEGTEEATWKDTQKVQKEISDKKIFYHLYLYKADYDYNSAVEYISQTDDIKKVTMGRYAAKEGSEVVYGTTNSSATLLYNMGRETADYKQAEMYDTELRTYLTYKITLRNEGSIRVKAEINELIDYHDETLQIIDRDVYAAIIDKETDSILNSAGSPNVQLVASGSRYYYYKAGQDTPEATGDVEWTTSETKEAGKAIVSGTSYDKDEAVNYVKETTNTFEDESLGEGNEIRLAKNERIEIYVTYRVTEENKTAKLEGSEIRGTNGFGENGKIKLGNKYNIAEIGNYSTYLNKEDDPNHEKIYGRVDKDSAPDNINLSDGDKAHYDDDGDAAPPIAIETMENTTDSLEVTYEDETIGSEFKQKYGGSRTITGVVWEDGRTVKIDEYEQYIGDGVYDPSEPGIQGVTVQLIEKIQTENGTEKEVLLPDIKDGSGEYIYKFETKTDTNGKYTFANIPAGTYVVRFIYGVDIIETPYATMNADDIVKYGPSNEIEVTAEEMPQTYNGQDFKSTSYQNISGIDNDLDDDGYIDNEWDRVTSEFADDRLSDARDNEVRRLENIAYSRTVNNKVATEMDLLSKNKDADALNAYKFTVGIVNGLPQVLIEDDLNAGKTATGISNSQTQDTSLSDGNYTIADNRALINQNDLMSNVAEYTWMYADTAKMKLGIENEMLIEEIKSDKIISNEYHDKYKTTTNTSIDYGDINIQEYAKDMLATITHAPRVVSVTAPAGDNTRESAIIYHVIPGQISVEGINNFEMDKEYLEEAFGYDTSSSSGSSNISSYPLVNRIYNVDFGIVERPKTSVELKKWVKSLALELSDGRKLFDIQFTEEVDEDTGIINSIIDENSICSSDVYDTSTEEGLNNLYSHFTVQGAQKLDPRLYQGFIYVNMDDELLQGATITVGYGLRVINTSEVDTVGLLSFFDDGDTIMQFANFTKEKAQKTTTMTNFIGDDTSFLGSVISEYRAKVNSLAGATSIEDQLLLLKYTNLLNRFETANAKLQNILGPSGSIQAIDDLNAYIMNTPTIAGNTNTKAQTPYGLLVGTTYYTGKAATADVDIYAVESKVEQIVDYVDNQLGVEDSKLLLENGSWAKLDITQLFGNYVQSNVLNGENPLRITNEGTLINIFESAVINVSEELLNELGTAISYNNEELEKEYMEIYQKLVDKLGEDITLQEFVHTLGEDGLKVLIEIFTSEDAGIKELLQKVVSGLTVVDEDGNSYITLEFSDDNELRNNILITVNDATQNPSLANYLVPKVLGTKASPAIFGTNNGLVDNHIEYESEVSLIAEKTVSGTALAEDINNMVFNNAAEIVQLSNKVGRKDKMAVAGNLLIGEGEWASTTGYDPESGEIITDRITLPSNLIFAEYDSAATARIIFSPPTGTGFIRIIHSNMFQGGLIGLIILAVGIVAIKLAFFKKKKIYK